MIIVAYWVLKTRSHLVVSFHCQNSEGLYEFRKTNCIVPTYMHMIHSFPTRHIIGFGPFWTICTATVWFRKSMSNKWSWLFQLFHWIEITIITTIIIIILLTGTLTLVVVRGRIVGGALILSFLLPPQHHSHKCHHCRHHHTKSGKLPNLLAPGNLAAGGKWAGEPDYILFQSTIS